MIGITEAFSASPARARTQFLEAAALAGLPIESHIHPLTGRAGKTWPWTLCVTAPPTPTSC